MNHRTVFSWITINTLKGLCPHALQGIKRERALGSLLLLAIVGLPAYTLPPEPPPRKPPTSLTGTAPANLPLLQSRVAVDY